VHGSPLPGADHTAAVLAYLTKASALVGGTAVTVALGACLPTLRLRSIQYLFVLEMGNLLCGIAKDIVHDLVGILAQHWRG
jgi:hypothetical protein